MFVERSQIVSEIQANKPTALQTFKSFDAVREVQLFKDLIKVESKLNMREWLAFSLLMESHAGAPENYPAWSEGIHLAEAPSRIEHRINPILLKQVDPEAFRALRLSSHFAFLHSI